MRKSTESLIPSILLSSLHFGLKISTTKGYTLPQAYKLESRMLGSGDSVLGVALRHVLGHALAVPLEAGGGAWR